MSERKSDSAQVQNDSRDDELLRLKQALADQTAQLVELRSSMRATLDATADAILVTDLDENVVDFNEQFQQLWQLPGSVMQSRQHRELLTVNSQKFADPQAFLTRVKEIYATRQEVTDHLVLLDGRLIERTSRMRYVDRRPTGWVWSFRDVTERKFTEEMKFRLAAVVESSQDAIITKSLDGIIQTWNAGAERIFGYTASEAVGQPITMLIPSDRKAEENQILERIARGERVASYVTERIRKNGSRLIVSLTISPMRDGTGKIIAASKIARDITQQKQAEELLRRSESELRTLADSIPQLAWMADPEGHVFWYNRGWYEYIGTTVDDNPGWSSPSVHDPEILPSVLQRWQQSLASGTPFQMEFPLRGRNGEFRWFLTRVNPLRDEAGRVIRWFGTNTDVDEVKRAEEALRDETRMLDLLNKTGIAIGSTLKLDDLLQAVTDAATQLSGAQFGAFFYNTVNEQGEGYTLYTLSGAPREAFDKFGQPRATPMFAATFRGEGPTRSDDVQADPRYGQLAPHYGLPKGHLPVKSFLAAPVNSRTGEVLGGLFFGHPRAAAFSERTERIIMGIASQAAVAIDNARLYENLRRAADERECLLQAERAARSEAERVSIMKDEFLATLSHELRTPLSAILGWSQVLSSGKVEPSDMAQGLEAIQRNARAQTQLIEDLLDMSRIISGKVRLDVQWTDLANVVEAAADSVRPSADAKGILLRKIIDPRVGPVSGDPTRLQQIAWNLLSNAIKFTPKGGKVDIILERVNSHLELTVRDNGIGIKPEFLPQVFERFRQADASTTRSYGGLGLGLSIVKSLVELHGGTVQATSEGEGQGSTFIVNLPLAPIHEADQREHPTTSRSSHAAQTAEIDLSGVKVLVVDDEPDARTLIKRVLSQYRAEVETAGSADEGLQKLRTFAPSVLISDIGMPGRDGYQFIRDVRKLPADQGGKTPSVALTAFARSEDRTRAMMAGFQLHIAKPIEPQELVATVGSLANRVGS
jgi:PAS domain S-box-containing protein